MSTRARITVAVLAVCVVVVWAGRGRSQSQVPGTLAPGAAPVMVVNDLKTQSAQAGPWQVSLTPNTAVGLVRDTTVSLASPEFIRTGQRYLVRLPNEPAFSCTFDRVDHGWVHAVAEGGTRWLNLNQIVSIQEAR